jgi:hypothetical protein
MQGRWRKKGTSNALECRAVDQAIRKPLRLPEAESITSILTRGDKTANCYNINRQAIGETLIPALSSLRRFADRVGLQLTAEHVPGVDNVWADRLSQISPAGDYALKPQVLQQVLCSWGKQFDADLFAAGWNTRHEIYCSTTKDRDAIGGNDFNITWKRFYRPLLHSPLPILPRVLHRLKREEMSAVVIAPAWRRQPWSTLLASMTVRSQILGSSDQVLKRRKRMAVARAELPPGDMGMYLVDTRMKKANVT